MGYRYDHQYKFVASTRAGNLGDLLKRFMDMPHDSTVRITKARSTPAIGRGDAKHGSLVHVACRGAIVEIEFDTLYVMDWASPTHEWLCNFVTGETAARTTREPHTDADVDCALFTFDPANDDNAMFYDMPTWFVCCEAICPDFIDDRPRAQQGPSVIQALMDRAAAKRSEQEGMS